MLPCDRLDHPNGYVKLHELTAWYTLAGATALALLGAALVWVNMNPERHNTFYEHKTCKMYIDEWHWETRTVARIGTGQDAARAHTCKSFAALYLHIPKNQNPDFGCISVTT